jgi:hypothetical protein
MKHAVKHMANFVVHLTKPTKGWHAMEGIA